MMTVKFKDGRAFAIVVKAEYFTDNDDGSTIEALEISQPFPLPDEMYFKSITPTGEEPSIH